MAAVCPSWTRLRLESPNRLPTPSSSFKVAPSSLGVCILVTIRVGPVLTFPILGSASSFSLASLKPSTFDPVPFCKLTAQIDFQEPSQPPLSEATEVPGEPWSPSPGGVERAFAARTERAGKPGGGWD